MVSSLASSAGPAVTLTNSLSQLNVNFMGQGYWNNGMLENCAIGILQGSFQQHSIPLFHYSNKPFPSSQLNCLKNLRSFWKNKRMSSIPYFSMAIRSTPMPKANPENFFGS